ncbi:MAG: PIN domain-containing protein [Candidatus Riflebacteria bacterium]|nr:PIN domain-containing protein [Candidatus Riflebacteria bacterium]
MKDRVFFDTNVLLYADDADAGERRSTARRLLAEAIRSGTGVVSTQVLQEYFVVATRKLGVAADAARRKVELLAQMDLIVVRLDVILGAIDLHRLHPISFWDALVVRAASMAGCRRLLTEDLQHGQLLEGVRVENPFASG